MEIAVRRLEAELEKVPIVDPHSHINPHAPAAKSLATTAVDLLAEPEHLRRARSVFDEDVQQTTGRRRRR